MTTSATMQAAVLEIHGAPFRITSVARPEPGPGQVMVRIHASGVNPLDTKIRAGAAAHARHPLPAILGIDLAGVVMSVGPGVTRFRSGDEVYGMTGGVGGHQGSLAEYAAVDSDLLAPKPSALTMREAAALPLVFITAWEGLVDAPTSRPGRRCWSRVAAVALATLRSRSPRLSAPRFSPRTPNLSAPTSNNSA